MNIPIFLVLFNQTLSLSNHYIFFRKTYIANNIIIKIEKWHNTFFKIYFCSEFLKSRFRAHWLCLYPIRWLALWYEGYRTGWDNAYLGGPGRQDVGCGPGCVACVNIPGNSAWILQVYQVA